MALILFLPYLSCTRAPPPITGDGRIINLRQGSPSVGFAVGGVGKPTILVGFRCKRSGFQFVFISKGSVHLFKFDLLPSFV
jgi:hypothetical protein